MQRVVAAPRELAVDGDQLLHVRNLAREDDALGGEPQLLGALRAADRGGDQRLAHHRLRRLRRGALRVFVHHPRHQLGVEASPVDADAHRLAVFDRLLDHHGELPVALRSLAHVAGVDPEFRERARAVRMIGEELVAVVMEVADERDRAAERIEALADRGHRGRGLRRVDGDADELRAGLGELAHLRDRGLDVGGVGVRHRLHDDRRAAADRHAADVDLARARPLDRLGACHRILPARIIATSIARRSFA